MSDNKRNRYRLFAPWPMLLGAITSFSMAVALGNQNRQDELADVLIVVGVVLIGAWIVLLTIAGHPGKDSDDDHVD